MDLSGIPESTLELFRDLLHMVAPPPKLTISEWADANRILPETSAEPGRWHTSRTPYLRAPMDAAGDPRVRKVVLMFASQTGKSEALNNIMGYYTGHDPSPIMMIQPSIELAEKYSKERLAPMFALSGDLAGKVSEPKSRNSNNTILHKGFPGGFLIMVGANAPRGLASYAVRVLLPDEVDGFPKSAGTEGDPIKLAEKRLTTFKDRNSIIVESSTPGVKGESVIERDYEDSTQEQWCLPCPSCGEMQPLEWGRLDFKSVTMACRNCGASHTEHEWKRGAGRWIARKEHPTTRGFHLNGMASPWLTWEDLIAEWHEAQEKGPEVLKTFVNTRLAETWEEGGESAEEDALASRRHYYNCDVPDGALLLTAGVDVQADRLELEVVGWGYGAENWGVQYAILPGDPNKGNVWQDLDAYLQRTFRRSDGAVLPIACTCVDSGYSTTEVYHFCRTRGSRYIFAIKGQGGPGQPEVGAYRKQGKNKDCPVFPVGSDSGKDMFMSRLGVENEGAGYCHWPREDLFSDGSLRGYTEEYFKGLSSEKRVERKSMGRLYHIWVKKSSHARNEALDCRVYASAALRILNPNWEQLANRKRPAQVQPGATKTPSSGRRVLSRGVQV